MSEPETQLTVHAAAGEPALARTDAPEAGEAESPARDTRLDRLPMELHVMVRVERMRVEDLLALERGTVLSTVTTENNGLTVTTAGGALLVSQGQVFQMTSGESGGVTHFYDAEGNDITADLTAGGGQIGGILTARDQDIPQAEGSLDALAYAVATAVNTQNEAGTDVNDQPGMQVFSLPATATAANPAGSAAGITAVLTDPNGIGAAAVGQGPSNNANAIAMADLANQGIVNGMTPTQDFADFVTSLGNQVTEVGSENTAQQAALTQLQNQIGSLSGVSLNDEAAQMETLTIDTSLSRLTAAATYTQSEQTQLTAAQTTLMQADVGQIATQLSTAETQQAALSQVIAKLGQQSLFNDL